MLERIGRTPAKVLYVTDRVLSELSEVETHQGILAVAELTVDARPWPAAQGPSLFVVAQGVQDPGNFGTLIRAAQAAGAVGVGYTKGTVDLLNPKVVRATAGAVFRIPVRALGEDWWQEAIGAGWRICATRVRGGVPYHRYRWDRPVALVLGNEGAGLSQPELPADCDWVTIPMAPGAESLNVAMAGAVLAFFAAGFREQT